LYRAEANSAGCIRFDNLSNFGSTGRSVPTGWQEAHCLEIQVESRSEKRIQLYGRKRSAVTLCSGQGTWLLAYHPFLKPRLGGIKTIFLSCSHERVSRDNGKSSFQAWRIEQETEFEFRKGFWGESMMVRSRATDVAASFPTDTLPTGDPGQSFAQARLEFVTQKLPGKRFCLWQISGRWVRVEKKFKQRCLLPHSITPPTAVFVVR
jgi:hypothetical protein